MVGLHSILTYMNSYGGRPIWVIVVMDVVGVVVVVVAAPGYTTYFHNNGEAVDALLLDTSSQLCKTRTTCILLCRGTLLFLHRCQKGHV